MLENRNVTSPEAAREKSRVALTSVLAAVVMTAAKLVAGLATGSLGILSEAAHSALDLAAALVTVFAVRASSRPPDQGHPYGHGKFENVSALFETLLLLGTCVWIIREAVLRLFFREVAVHGSILGFLVILGSIAVDFGRSRALLKVARKYQSQALEADALHFSTDILSSAVVLVGLGLVALAERFHLPWLGRADALAALCVAGIVVWISVQLGRKALDEVLDAVPPGLLQAAREAVLAVDGVEGVGRVRLRRTGPEWFSDVAIQVEEGLSTQASHEVADRVEAAMKVLLPEGDCVVHVEPVRLQKG